MDQKQRVREGYNKIATDYLAARMASHHDVALLEELVERLPHGARVLDAGCGAGIPVTRFLARHFSVLGVDISDEQINLARVSVPSASFVRKDMTALGLDDASYDAVVCFYAIFHIPKEQHPEVLANFYRLLKLNGLLLICVANTPEAHEGSETFFSESMFYSSPAVADSVATIAEIGFELIWQKELDDPLDENSSQLFVLARKPQGPNT